MTEWKCIVVGGLYKLGRDDELVTVISVGPRVRVSKARGYPFYRVSLLLNGMIVKVKVGTKSFQHRGEIIVADDRTPAALDISESHFGLALKALCLNEVAV